NGLIDLCDADNDVTTFAATSTTDAVYFHDVNEFTVGTVTGGALVTVTQIGVTAGTDAPLHARTNLTIEEPVQATNTVGLEAVTGFVKQTATGKIVADALSVQADDLIDLCESANNNVNTFAATSTTDSVYYHDLDGVKIDTVAGGTCV